jgi:hypothetical protein
MKDEFRAVSVQDRPYYLLIADVKVFYSDPDYLVPLLEDWQ